MRETGVIFGKSKVAWREIISSIYISFYGSGKVIDGVGYFIVISGAVVLRVFRAFIA